MGIPALAGSRQVRSHEGGCCECDTPHDPRRHPGQAALFNDIAGEYAQTGTQYDLIVVVMQSKNSEIYSQFVIAWYTVARLFCSDGEGVIGHVLQRPSPAT